MFSILSFLIAMVRVRVVEPLLQLLFWKVGLKWEYEYGCEYESILILKESPGKNR